MAALEEAIREAAKRGLTHLSLHPVPSEDGKKIYWRCTATPSTMHKYVSTSSLDPVDAVAAVLASLPKAPKRAQTSATKAQTPATDDGPVTVAVSDPAAKVYHTTGRDPAVDAAVDIKIDPTDEWSKYK